MSQSLDNFELDAQVLAKQLREDPDLVLYPTEHYFEVKEMFTSPEHMEYGMGIAWINLKGFMGKPITVKKAVEEHILSRYPIYMPKDLWKEVEEYPKLATNIYEGYWPETEIAAGIIQDFYTLDPREAAIPFRDKYVGPRDLDTDQDLKYPIEGYPFPKKRSKRKKKRNN